MIERQEMEPRIDLLDDDRGEQMEVVNSQSEPK